MVDKPLILRKIDRIETYLKQIRHKKNPGIVAFKKDTDLQGIILFNLIQSIQSCIDIGTHIISDSGWEMPGSQADIFETLIQKKVITKLLAGKMIKMIGFRNRIVHEYEKIDLKIVYEVWRRNIGDIERFCKAVVLKYGL
ncbi:MAG: DUF86 domain-containing protein [Nitrospirota bacterium]|nr:DUF86 domain-containing protein [Nitrospirota bacterium]